MLDGESDECRNSSDFRFPFPVFGLAHHRLVAFAGRVFQSWPTHYVYLSSRIFDESCSLQNASGDRDACPSCAEHKANSKRHSLCGSLKRISLCMGSPSIPLMGG